MLISSCETLLASSAAADPLAKSGGFGRPSIRLDTSRNCWRASAMRP